MTTMVSRKESETDNCMLLCCIMWTHLTSGHSTNNAVVVKIMGHEDSVFMQFRYIALSHFLIIARLLIHGVGHT